MKSLSLGEGLIDPLLDVNFGKKNQQQKKPSSEKLNLVIETLNCSSHSHLGVKFSSFRKNPPALPLAKQEFHIFP